MGSQSHAGHACVPVKRNASHKSFGWRWPLHTQGFTGPVIHVILASHHETHETHLASWMGKGWTWQPGSWMNLEGSCPCEPCEPRSLGLGTYRCAQSLRVAATCALLPSLGLFPRFCPCCGRRWKSAHLGESIAGWGPNAARQIQLLPWWGMDMAWTAGSLWFAPFCNELLVNASRVSTYSAHGSESAYHLAVWYCGQACSVRLWFLRIKAKAKRPWQCSSMLPKERYAPVHSARSQPKSSHSLSRAGSY